MRSIARLLARGGIVIAYVVVDVDFDDSSKAVRVYLDREEAQAFVTAYNATGGYLEVEEIRVGAPDVEYDGPLWIGEWSTRRKQVGERQLVIVTDGFAMVIPSAVPAKGYSIEDVFALKASGPGWRALAGLRPEYEEPPVWIDSFRYTQTWHTGDHPILAGIYQATDNHLEVRGTSKYAVEQLLRETALRMKGDR